MAQSVLVHRIEFHDFKSYKGNVSVGPFTNFSCVVGPNGSGKSNILDGLAFVLSGSVSRAGPTGQPGDPRDLINRTVRAEQGAKAECSVALVLLLGGTDEHSFKRSVRNTAKAENAVELRYNNKVVSDKDFAAALRRFRIGSRVGNFVVFQHEVEAVAHKKAKEITDLLEQVSGSGELKAEYNKRRKEYDAITDSLQNASLEKRGAATEMQHLKLQKKEAEKYEALQAQLTTQRRDLALAELYHYEAQLRLRKRQLQEQENKKKELEKRVNTEEDMRKSKKAFAEQHKLYLELVKQNKEATLKLREKKSVLERLRGSLEHHQKKIKRLTDDLGATEANTASRSKEVETMTRQKEQQQSLLDQLEDKWKKEDAELARTSSLSADDLKEYKAVKADVDTQTVTVRQQIETLRRQRDALNVALKQVSIAQEATESSKRDTQSTLERTQAQQRGMKAKMAELAAQEQQLVGQLAHTNVLLASSGAKAAERDATLAELDAKLSVLKFEKDTTKQAARISDAINSLTSMFPGRVHGRMVDLCVVPEGSKYKNAVTVAFGKFLDAIVVDTTETAMGCVRYLKEQRVASMAFIPLNNAQGNVVTDALRALGGTAKPAIDILQFDPLLEPAVRFALGDTLVCDTVAEARRVAYGAGGVGGDSERRKVVTLDGTVLLKNGAVQGGLAATQSRAKKWDEKTYDDLKARRELILRQAGESASDADLERIRFEVKELQSNIEFTRGRAKAAVDEEQQLIKKVAQLERQLAASDEQLEAFKGRVADTGAQMKRLEDQMQTLQKQVAELSDKAFAGLQKKTGIANLAEYEQRTANQARIRAEKRQSLLVTINRIEKNIEAEMKRNAARGGLGEIQKSLEKAKKEAASNEKDVKTNAALVDQLQAQQQAVEKALREAKDKLDQIEADNRKNSKTSDAEVRELAATRKLLTMLGTTCEALRASREACVSRCGLEQIDLPTVDGSVDEQAADPFGNASSSSSSDDDDDANAKKNNNKKASKKPTGKKTGGVRRGRETEADPAGEGIALHLVRYSESFSIAGTYEDSSNNNNKKGSNNNNNKKRGAGVLVRIDFSQLSEAVRRALEKKEAFAAYKKKAESQIEQLTREADAIVLPNLRAARNLDATEQKLGTSATAVDELRVKQKKAAESFNTVKEMRFSRFMATFEKLSEHVDAVYGQLTAGTRAEGVRGSAYLTLEDTDEPYNGGTLYHATPPMKRFMTMDSLSGGERTMAALALLFSIHCAMPTPFFVLDEVDAALDIGNVGNLANYMRERSGSCQFLVVSLKEQLYHKAESLIGVYKDVQRETSAVLSLDVTKIREAYAAAAAASAAASAASSGNPVAKRVK